MGKTNPTLDAAPAGTKLDADQLATYHEQGYVVADAVFPGEEVAAINGEIDRLQAEKPDAFLESGLYQLGLRSPVTDSICRNERILTLIEDIVSPGIAVYSAKMVHKPPHSDLVCHWHQDNAYYNQHAESRCRMSIWLSLQDTTEHNGCLWIVPGSHRGGTLPAEKRGNGHCDLAFEDGRKPLPDAIPCPLGAGDVLLFHADLWHRSLGNHSDKPRRSFIVSYQEASAARGNGAQHKILRPS